VPKKGKKEAERATDWNNIERRRKTTKTKKQGKSENSLGKGFRQQMHMVRRERRN
jgi:hypothetical protein